MRALRPAVPCPAGAGQAPEGLRHPRDAPPRSAACDGCEMLHVPIGVNGQSGQDLLLFTAASATVAELAASGLSANPGRR